MCFTTTKNARAKTAKTDIECWKFLNPDYSPYFGISNCKTIPYKKDIKNKIQRVYSINGEINQGYHSCKSDDIAQKDMRKWTRLFDDHAIIKKFIIPAGTRYYENETEYVSKSIIML